jgi:Tfp pilus assembly protein PilO
VSRRVIAVAVVVALVLFIGWSVAVKSPQSKAIKKAQQRQSAAATEVVALQAQAAVLLKQKAGLPAVEAQLAALKQALPAKAALDQVIDEIRQTAATSGVNLTSLSQSAGAASPTSAAPTVATNSLQQVSLTMAVTGTYTQLVNYLTELNLLARTMVVDNLSLGSTATPGGVSGALSAQITGRMFYVPVGS